MPHLGTGTLIGGCYSPAKKLETLFCGLLSTQVCLQEYKPRLQGKIVNSSFWPSLSQADKRLAQLSKFVLAQSSGPCLAKAQVLGSTGALPYSATHLKHSHLS